MDQKQTCPECGKELFSEIKGHSLTILCKNCDWRVATSYFSPIERDTTSYCLYVEKGQLLTVDQLRVICRQCKLNYLQLRKAMKDSDYLLYEGQAVELFKIKKELLEQKIKFFIMPDFDY